MSNEQKSFNRTVAHLLVTNHVVFADGERRVLWGFFKDMSRYSKWDGNICIFARTAAITRAIYQSTDNRASLASFESTSGQSLVNSVQLCVTQRRHAQRCRLWRLLYSNNTAALAALGVNSRSDGVSSRVVVPRPHPLRG